MSRVKIIEWRAPQLMSAVDEAAKRAIDDTTREAAEVASAAAPRRYGQLASEVVNEPAKKRDGRIVGKFGSTKRRGFYGLFFERRTPFLRPAADQTFPRVAAHLRDALRGTLR